MSLPVILEPELGEETMASSAQGSNSHYEISPAGFEDRIDLARPDSLLKSPHQHRRQSFSNSSLTSGHSGVSDQPPKEDEMYDDLSLYITHPDNPRRGKRLTAIVDGGNRAWASLIAESLVKCLDGWKPNPEGPQTQFLTNDGSKRNLRWGDGKSIEVLGAITLGTKFHSKDCAGFMEKNITYWVVSDSSMPSADCVLNQKILLRFSTILDHAAGYINSGKKREHQNCSLRLKSETPGRE